MRSEARANALVLAGSAALLGGALAFQYFGGLHPCEMCLWQRYAHVAALALGLLAWRARSNRLLVALAAVAVLVSGGIGVFHAGVERHWWQGITRCAATPLTGDVSAVLGSVLATPLVRCDAAAWSLFGISMAGYNALLSTLTGGTALWLLRRR